MKNGEPKDGMTPSQRITNHIEELADWRGEMLAWFRQLINEAEPDLVEEWKWNSPVWSHHGKVISFGVFKDHVKLNFFKGASLKDPHGLFNAGLEAKTTRGIDMHEGDEVNVPSLKKLIRQAVAFNVGQ